MSQNIIISELTQNGYEELYPKTRISQIDGVIDPMGEWFYCGRSFDVGKEYQISFNVENFGKTVSEIINQICLRVNNCDIKFLKENVVIQIQFRVGVTYKDATQQPDVLNLSKNIYYGAVGQDSLNLLDKIKNEKFLLYKLARETNILYNGNERPGIYYL